jgi:Tol biopolymer transport system component
MVVFMRYFGGVDWRVVSVNVATGAEQELTSPGVTSAIPEWSGDGKTIVYVNFDKTRLENLGLYTMAPSGANKQKIPLPGGYLYTHPSFPPPFFPGTGSGTTYNGVIIYSARRVPGLPGVTEVK